MPLNVYARSRHNAAIFLVLVAAVSFGPAAARAHEEGLHCAAVVNSVAEAGFDDGVTVGCAEDQAVIRSDTYPDHPMMTGIVGTNEQVPVPASDYTSPITLQPTLGTVPQTRDAALGVAVNGVPIYDYTGGGEMSAEDLSEHQTQHDTILTQQLDICGGHAGRGDDYHYHTAPVCMIEQMANAGPEAIIGWAFDGFPIYGDDNPDGTPIPEGTLDVCNGQPDATFGYRYHTSQAAPYIIQCLMGEVQNMRDLPRVPPLEPAGGGRGPEAGFPPQGGVENLLFTQDATGLRSMTYTYHGENFYMNYAPSETANCYDFETRTVTNNGEIFAAELCR